MRDVARKAWLAVGGRNVDAGMRLKCSRRRENEVSISKVWLKKSGQRGIFSKSETTRAS